AEPLSLQRLGPPDHLPASGATAQHQHLLPGLLALRVLAVQRVPHGEPVRRDGDVAEDVDLVLQLLERMRARMVHVVLVAAHDRLAALDLGLQPWRDHDRVVVEQARHLVRGARDPRPVAAADQLPDLSLFFGHPAGPPAATHLSAARWNRQGSKEARRRFPNAFSGCTAAPCARSSPVSSPGRGSPPATGTTSTDGSSAIRAGTSVSIRWRCPTTCSTRSPAKAWRACS